jgi:homoserine kinase
MSFTRAEAFAPATMANLGVGFDILGLALCEPGDIVRVTRRDQPGVAIVSIEGDGGVLTRDARKNTASVAANAFLQLIGAQGGVEMTVYKHLPLASGLGSSAASAVAAVMAVNALFGSPLTLSELLPACLEGEACVSGYHADNVAPSLFGGITLVMGVEAGQIRRLPVPSNLHLALVTPDVAVPTSEARAVLPKMIPLGAMVSQTAAVARLVDALYRQDLEEMAAAMERDSVIEPARAHLMPMLNEVRAAAKQAGALGMVISGAGPTLCAICDDEGIAKSVAAVMKAIYAEAGMNSTSRHTQVGIEGARVLKLV